MPHQCTNCARVFDDGSKEMLSGCPSCGGNKFQFKPDGASESSTAVDDAPEPPEPPTSSSVARTVGKTAATVRDIVGGSGDEPTVGAERSTAGDGRRGSTAEPGSVGDPGVAPAREDTAQASARTDVVAADELPTSVETETEHRFRPVRSDDGSPTNESGEPATAGSPEPTDDGAEDSSSRESERPDLDELRAELNDQFESIKVLNPGQYELNLMGLYDREEYIIALQEDGRYSIQVPETIGT